MPDEQISCCDERTLCFDKQIICWWILLPKTYHIWRLLLIFLELKCVVIDLPGLNPFWFGLRSWSSLGCILFNIILFTVFCNNRCRTYFSIVASITDFGSAIRGHVTIGFIGFSPFFSKLFLEWFCRLIFSVRHRTLLKSPCQDSGFSSTSFPLTSDDIKLVLFIAFLIYEA